MGHLFIPWCCVLRIMSFLTCLSDSFLLLFTRSMKMRTICWFFKSYHKLQKDVWNIYLSLVCSLGSPPRRLCMAMDSPKAISLFLTIQHIHAWLPFQETWGLGLTTFFSPCVLWMHCWHLHFLSSQLSSS